MNILLVNGYQNHPFSKGELNTSLFNIYFNEFRNKHNVMISSVENYNIIEERNKFLWADTVVFQFPIYWFDVPGKLKLYMDEIFEYNQFYSFADKYGTGGLMKNTSYMLSTTWNAPISEFNNDQGFFEGKNVDDVLLPFHKTMQFCGFTQKKSISFHNVVKECQFELYQSELLEHIKKEF
ncbi:NAD(P)H-dependent oxidoreductase [Enterococcus faecalis]|uniref:NAD(P)H-dependent oxidoreductase n=1 Tax=Enterococcus faecalis TaxID=1351 RepID=UPI00325B811D